MKVLLDNNITHHFARSISGHVVIHARAMQWETLSNGELIARAESDGFDVLITADRGMEYQQNITSRKISVILIKSKRITLAHLLVHLEAVQTLLDDIEPGQFRRVGD